MQVVKRRRRRLAAPLGTLFVVFVVIGIITVIAASIRLTVVVLDNSREKVRLADTIRPVVMFNPVPFESPKEIDPVSLLQYSMWAALLGDNHDAYGYGSSTGLTIPASDLDLACANLFGPDVTLVHQNFATGYDVDYYYDAAKNVYNVMPTAQLYVYSPEINDIKQDGEFINLTVDYIPPGDAWTTTFEGSRNQPAPEKQMIYVMKKIKDGYQLVKIKDVPPAQSEAAGNNG